MRPRTTSSYPDFHEERINRWLSMDRGCFWYRSQLCRYRMTMAARHSTSIAWLTVVTIAYP
jgi:hypothetical protein